MAAEQFPVNLLTIFRAILVTYRETTKSGLNYVDFNLVPEKLEKPIRSGADHYTIGCLEAYLLILTVS